ncbi:MAG: FAD-dependent oxidoreductase [Candidatus Vogelbacteria bacterium]|nr:FAD-dependent oxidoreductase [Candidatus Vogelbacteria bacterium]
MLYDLVIIGGGPAGVAAGVYAARKKLQTLFLTYDFGGQSMVSAEIQNWIGTPAVSGEELAKQLEAHLRTYEGENLVIKVGVKAEKIEKSNPSTAVGVNNFFVRTDDGQTYEGRTVLITTGAHRRKLTIPGAETFEQKGITYCATCDGPLFAGKDVVVIGGGNAGFETALQLLAYAKSVILIHHSAEFKADPVTVEKVLTNPKMTAIKNAETVEIKGDKFVKSLIYKDKITGAIKELATEGVFVEIGLVPTTEMVEDLVTLNPYGAIVVDPKNQRASVPGIWAAGDCTDGLYHQNNIAAGDAVKALEDIYNYLHLGK